MGVRGSPVRLRGGLYGRRVIAFLHGNIIEDVPG
jgi:hypothetical protein